MTSQVRQTLSFELFTTYTCGPALGTRHTAFAPDLNIEYGVPDTVWLWYKCSAVTNVAAPVTDARWQRKI